MYPTCERLEGTCGTALCMASMSQCHHRFFLPFFFFPLDCLALFPPPPALFVEVPPIGTDAPLGITSSPASAHT
jgi:hypothetical protein